MVPKVEPWGTPQGRGALLSIFCSWLFSGYWFICSSITLPHIVCMVIANIFLFHMHVIHVCVHAHVWVHSSKHLTGSIWIIVDVLWKLPKMILYNNLSALQLNHKELLQFSRCAICHLLPSHTAHFSINKEEGHGPGQKKKYYCSWHYSACKAQRLMNLWG